MAAHENLSSGQFLYHYADPSARESIAEKGLLTRNPDGGSLAEDDGQPAGVYGFHDRRQADVLEGDTWQVDTTGLQVHSDPFHADKPGVASYIPHDVPPERLKRIHP